MTAHEMAPVLSICIATFKRAGFITETVESIMGGLPPGVEVIIVDGASPDDTAVVMQALLQRFPGLAYFREIVNSGIDRDYDKAVGYARGRYCWLMTDDDLLVPGAVARVLSFLDDAVDLVVVNAEVRNADLSITLRGSQLRQEGPSEYAPGQLDDLLAETGTYLSFIGAVVIRRGLWLARKREAYYETLFIHIGVIFQGSLDGSTRVIREPLIVIRYGNAMWSARGFEIWLFKWPSLIWSFAHIARSARQSVIAEAPYRSPKQLLWYRAIGVFSRAEFDAFLSPRLSGPSLLTARALLRLPSKAANALCACYFLLRSEKHAKMQLYDLARASTSTAISRAVARLKHSA